MFLNSEYILGAVLILIFCLLLTGIEKRNLRTIFTPFSVLAWPYAAVICVINLFAVQYGFYPVSIRCILFIIVSLLFFFIGGMIIPLFFRKSKPFYTSQSEQVNIVQNTMDFFRPLFILLAIISIITGIFHLIHSIHDAGGWFFIASKKFEDTYGKGVLSHIMLINRPAFLFLAADNMYKKRITKTLLLVTMFLLILVLQIKNHIFTILLGGFYFAYLYGLTKVNLKKIILYSVIVYILFYISYMIGFSRIGLSNASSTNVQYYLINLFFTYLFGGPIGFSEILNDSTYPLYSMSEIFAVPVNLYNALAGDPKLVNIIFFHWIPVSNRHMYFHTSNVFGLFGMVYMYVGTYATWLYMFFTGIIAYLLRFLSLEKTSFIGFKMIYAFMLSFLTLSFFGLYFNILLIYEASLYMILFPLIYLLLMKIIGRMKINICLK